MSNRSATQKLQRNEFDLLSEYPKCGICRRKVGRLNKNFILREAHADDGILPGGLRHQSNGYGI